MEGHSFGGLSIMNTASDGRDNLGAAATAAAHASEYLDVLGPGGSVSPREVAYRGRQDQAQIIADVSAFYGAFPFSTSL